MVRTFLKKGEVVNLLKSGAEIFTDRGFGNAPYTPLFFRIYEGKKWLGNIHHATIKSLIANETINSKEDESGSGKYKLRVK